MLAGMVHIEADVSPGGTSEVNHLLSLKSWNNDGTALRGIKLQCFSSAVQWCRANSTYARGIKSFVF